MRNNGQSRGKQSVPRASLIQFVPDIAAGMVIALATAVLLGWQFDIELLKRIRPQFVAMNPTTALFFLLSSVTLILTAHGRALVLTRIVASIIGIFGLLNFIACLGGPDLHLDQLLYNLQTGAPVLADSAVRTNRIAPNTALLFMIVGTALFLTRYGNIAPRIVSKCLAITGMLVSLIAIVGYINGVATLYRPTTLTPMAAHTALGFLTLCLGLFFVEFERGFGWARNEAEPSTDDLSALKRKISLGFGVALFFLGVIGVVSYASIHALGAAHRTAQDARHTLGTISELLASMSDAETGERGFVLTDKEIFLEPYKRALLDIPRELQELEAAIAGDAFQRAQFEQLKPLVAQELDFLQTVVKSLENGSLTQSERLISTGQGKAHMDAVRAVIGAMRNHENALSDGRGAEVDHTTTMSTAIITAGIFIALCIVCLAGWFVRGELAHRQLAAKQLRAAEAAANEANESKSRFLANMSHEIRTPMAAIIGYADLVLDPTQTPSDRLDHINTIRRNGEHLLTLINDILDLSKIEAGKLHAERVSCCPCQVLSDVASLMRIRALERKIRLEIKNEGPIPAKVITDPARLRQILINLVGNAIKFTEEGFVKLVMTLQEPANGEPHLKFEVIDTGIGMSAEQVGRLFQPFSQADASTTRKFGGTGLGLMISKRLAEMLGGNIVVDSYPNRGSTFTLTVATGPLVGVQRLNNCREALAGMDLEQAASPVSGVDADILLVDDGEDNRRLLSVYLRNAGARVTLAENGRIGADKALEAAAAGKPFDVILMDMQMPELDGYGATALLRSKGYKGPIVALTANAMAEDCDKCLSIGCTDYLSKPVRREKLLLTVARHLQHGQTSPGAAALGTNAALLADLPVGVIKAELSDETLRPHLLMYVSELPARVAEIETLFDQANLEQLSGVIHNLKGSGGLYGLMPITDAAARAEAVLRKNDSMDSIRMAVAELTDILRRVEGFGRASEKPEGGKKEQTST